MRQLGARRPPCDTIPTAHGAAHLLEAIATSLEPPTAAELARSTGLNASTCHLLNTLEVGRLSEAALRLPELIGELEELNARKRETEDIWERGHAEEVEEYAPGIACLAAPILVAGGEVVGSLAISASVDCVEAEREALGVKVVRVGTRASARLGHR